MRISDWSSDVCSSDLAEIAPAKWADPDEPEYFERDCYDLGKAFDACLVEAGLTRPVIGADGNPVFLPARRNLGQTESRPTLRGSGPPKPLRTDRKSVESGKDVSVRVNLGGGLIIKHNI